MKEVKIKTILMQIYGELNRIRLIIGENSIAGERIKKFDKEKNNYNPFFNSEKEFKKYPHPKNKNIIKKIKKN